MSDAAWSESDSATFIEYGSIFVPERERQITTIVDRIFAEPEPPGHVIELCSGAGDLAREVLDRSSSVTLQCFDASDAMLAETRKRVSDAGDRLTTTSFRLEAPDWRTPDLKADAVVSSLAIHHLDDEGKQRLFSDVHTMLNPGGVFVIADLVEPVDAASKVIFAVQWDEEVKRRSQDRFGDLRGFERFRELGWNYYRLPGPDDVDMPSTLIDQLDWMRSAGFERVEVHWHLAGHVIFSGGKAG